jgi:cyanophycinase
MIFDRAAWLLAVLVLAPACAHEPVHEAPTLADRGNLVLVGGGAKPPEAMRLFVDLAGGAGAHIVVLPLASGDSREAGADYVVLFGALGVADVRVIHIDDRRDALRPEYARVIGGASGVFFSGGDQSRIAARIVDTPVLDAVRAVKARGGVIGGTSAGTACQSAVMLVGAGNERRMRAGNIAVTRGIGLFEGVVVDSHFSQRRRFVRLKSVVLEHPSLMGIGVDEATAAWVKPDGTLEVVGRHSVTVYDAANAAISQSDEGDLLAPGLKEITLTEGQRFDLHTRERIAP